ncbi:glutathione peroxidase [Salinicoccus sp. ID82-1]|uniref:Glutathione peroxidase n=1 Tax=Salinicoccus cyprini TaxID=2493691 RepID=A0A558AYB6_9STAP|nr:MULTISPECIES: glutathione peroxidase [Salinicoccus]MCG1008767.1 glutathione peroxidase [Salinicoccus sp. ID82-1]TVT29242.1 glutathione peroxidase [Salinicoccus cyprini]
MKTHIYDLKVHDDTGIPMDMRDFEGKAILIINTASECTFCNQLSELEFLYQKYKDEGLRVLVFPSDDFMNSEPLDASEARFHYNREYGVTFDVMEKVNVKGDSIHPLFKHLTESKNGLLTNTVKWNFTKFLISREGRIVKRFPPQKSPLTFEDDILRVLRG